MSASKALRDLPILAHMGDSQIEQLAELATVRKAPSDVTFLEQGTAASHLLLLSTGKAQIRRVTTFGTVLLRTLDQGNLLGEPRFIDGRAHTNEALAVSEIELLALEAGGLTSLIDDDLRMGITLYWSFWRSLSAKLRHTLDRLSSFFGRRLTKDHSAPPPTTAVRQWDFRVDLEAKRGLFQEQRLSRLEINLLASLSQEQKLAPGQVVFSENERGDAMYVVLEGQVMISRFIPGAGEEALAFLERGAYFGEMALMDNQPRSATARAHGAGAVVLSIPRDVVDGLLDIQKVSSLNLLELLCGLIVNRLDEAEEKLIGWNTLAESTPGADPFSRGPG